MIFVSEMSCLSVLHHHGVKEKEETDRRKGGKTISKSGREWILPAQLEQPKTGQDGKELLRILL